MNNFTVKTISDPLNIEITNSLHTGGAASFKVRPLKKHEKKKLCRVLGALEQRLPENLADGLTRDFLLEFAQKGVFFCATSSREIGAYSSGDPEHPLVIFNKLLFRRMTQSAFMVSLLHEITHFVFESKDNAPTSNEEAMHDLWCYSVLGLEMPADHWAAEVEVTEEEAREFGFRLKEEA